MRATLDTHIRLKRSDLPEGAESAIKEALEFRNKEKLNAKKEKRYGWNQMPDTIRLWETDGKDSLILPRGFKSNLEEGIEAFEDKIVWDRRTKFCQDFDELEEFKLRPHQSKAAESIIENNDGIYQAPPGSGKTVTVLEVIRRLTPNNSLIVVDKINIAEQWKERVKQFLGVPAGIIGDNTWEEQNITIATVQTLYSRLNDLDAKDWWSEWDLVCLDECHHQTASTFRVVMQRFPSEFRFGVSATPSKTGDFEYALAVLGDIIHETKRSELRNEGILVNPSIVKVETKFDFPYHGTMEVSKWEACEVKGCKKEGKKRHMHRNNYQSLIKELVHDTERTTLIVDNIMTYGMCHKHLVISKRLNHLSAITRGLQEAGYPGPIRSLVGADSRSDRAEVVEAIESDDECVVVSTIADEALDVPSLDRLHLTFPSRNEDLVRQQIGRVERASSGKYDAVVYDYADVLVPVLSSQYRTRRWGVYAKELYKVYHGLEGDTDENF